MTMGTIKELGRERSEDLLAILKDRFVKNSNRHTDLDWEKIQSKLEDNPEKLSILNEMEITGGEPDVTGYDNHTDKFIFVDCSPESPAGRRSYCYDRAALDKRKENKPKNNAIEAAETMGIEILSEAQYRELQKLGTYDSKTSSWIKTPENIRILGGAIFADFRFQTVFVYHNGADSYYAARGFRGLLRV